MYSDILEVIVTSTLISFLITPFMRMIAFRINYVDHPQDNKIHARPMPLLGGVAIFVSFFIGMLSQWDVVADIHGNQMLAILAGSFLLLSLGLVDDKLGMVPKTKLLGQFLAAMIVYKSGLHIQFLNNYYLNLIITYLWIVGITNSFNLLDNMNGLSAGIAAIAAFFFGTISWMNGQPFVSIISFCLFGSCLGFLRYNFPKASIFMGDAGSLVIGFVLSCIALLGNWRSYEHLTSIAIPIVVLAYPIFDTTLVTILRLLERRSIFSGGRDHSSHRIALLGLKAKNAVIFIYLLCFLLGGSAVAISRVSFRMGIFIAVSAAASLIFMGIRLSRVESGRFGRKKGINGD